MFSVQFPSKLPGILFLLLAVPGISSCLASPELVNEPAAVNHASLNASIPVYRYEVVNAYPHDRAAFTQGLVFDNGILYEGTGLYGKSTLRKVDLETGDVQQSHELPAQYFGEGVTAFGDRLIQLTWKSKSGFIYDKNSFKLIGDFTYATEGWGITHDGERLIMSDGTSTLYFLDPENFRIIGHVEVHHNDIPVDRLNELEYIKGQVYANIWQTDNIAVIDLNTGQLTAWLDLSGLLQSQEHSSPVDVLNGIAYDGANDRLFVTGKLWPWLFEIKLVDQE